MKPQITALPAPNREYSVAFPALSGGLNLADPDGALPLGESPDMDNLLWENGHLASRPGQAWVSAETSGTGYAAAKHLWHGHLFCHIGDGLYCFSPSAPDAAKGTKLCSGMPAVRGTFFLYHNCLFYKTRGAYKQIAAPGGDGSFLVSDVEPYVPVVRINASPDGLSGDLYQPENRLSPRKTVWFNAQSGVTQYVLPVVAARIVSVEVDGVKLPSGWAYNYSNGTVKFSVAPPVTNPPTNNTVRITYELPNPEAQKAVDDCRYAAVFGGTGALCICLAGSEAQPNLMLWNGQDSRAMNPGYFPLEQYQLCGETEERITGFGCQQSDLVIFKEHSVGKTAMQTAELNGRLSIAMPYLPVNARTGCAFPWSIELVENNLVWANRAGVFTLRDTSPALENTILCLSRKIDGSSTRPGLRAALSGAEEDAVCSLTDGTHYFLTAGQKTFAWNYAISTPARPSWFPLTGVAAVAYAQGEGNAHFHLNALGQMTRLTDTRSDYGAAIPKHYRFATQTFGSYDRRKNIHSVLITLGAETPSRCALTYLTDYESRRDRTDLQIVPEEEYAACHAPGTRPQSSWLPAVFRRRPMCLRVLHFALRLQNSTAGEDLAIFGAEIFYTRQGRLR